MPVLAWTYTTLKQALQDWPEDDDDAYVANIDNIIGLGELRLIRELNLDLFDKTDQTLLLDEGTRLITKPADLVVLRTLRLAQVITSVPEVAADDDAICLAQVTSFDEQSLGLTGVIGSAAMSPPRCISAAETNDSEGGIRITVSGTDASGFAISEVLITGRDLRPVQGTVLFASVTGVTCELGDVSRQVKVGVAVGVGLQVLGQSFPLERRSKAYCDEYAPDVRRADRPVYFNELNETTWEVVDTADVDYTAIAHYVRRPPGLANAVPTTWLGTNVPDALFAACLMEAEHYLQADDRYGDWQSKYYNELLPAARLELRNLIRGGDAGPFKPAPAPG